eukprot:TRINITY_DN66983_c0_g1_i1.p1 TRINITY_DN66983_c0_g1~~TRINITY_DN66983_c0_g1_i1.p1  ORF type:complete len:191 (-),score=15.47 TRINITY_DN66983_c0_g1_i1:155-727(-)
MGGTYSRIEKWWKGKPKLRILMIGVDAAGKTTMLYKLKYGEIHNLIPTIGMNIETLEKPGEVTFTCWDIGGSDKIWPLYRHYYVHHEINCIILMVDSNDTERIHIVKKEMNRLLTEDLLQHAPLLVLANKQDLPNAQHPRWVADQLDLQKLNRNWYIQGCCATTGEGLQQGIDWLHQAVCGEPDDGQEQD